MTQIYGYQIVGPVYSAMQVLGSGSGGGVTSHGALTGLTSDDHSQYVLAAGTRPLTGNWNFGSFDISGTGDIYCTDLYTSSVSGTSFYGDGSNLTGIDHDGLDGFVADEHIDWKSTNQDLVTAGNITGNSIYCGGFLRSTNAPNCQIRYTNNNTFEFNCGNKTYLIMNAYGDLVINEGGYNNNGLRCESNNNANMLKVDPVNDRVGIGDGTPSYTLDVAGDVRATGDYRSSDGTAGVSGWYDDGVNFRVTVKNGLITNIGTTVSGGYSMT